MFLSQDFLFPPSSPSPGVPAEAADLLGPEDGVASERPSKILFVRSTEYAMPLLTHTRVIIQRLDWLCAFYGDRAVKGTGLRMQSCVVAKLVPGEGEG